MKLVALSIMLIIGMLSTLTGAVMVFDAFENLRSKAGSTDHNAGLIDMILLSVTLLQFVVSAHFTFYYYHYTAQGEKK